MQAVTTEIARVFALESGAELIIRPGVAHDTTDAPLRVVVAALLERLEGTGALLVAAERAGSTLVVSIDETEADEPLCPAAVTRVVRRLSYDLLGETWEAELCEAVPASTETLLVA
jgi:hypothetical protein